MPASHRVVGPFPVLVRAASAVLLLAGLAAAPAAGQMSFEPLGIAAGYESSKGLSVSGDGLTAGTESLIAAGGIQAAWWRAGVLHPFASGEPWALTASGSFLAGTIGTTAGAFRYSTVTAVTDTIPGFGAAGARMLAYDLTDDGSMLVGSIVGPTFIRPVPSYWTQASGHVQLPFPAPQPPIPAPDQGQANAVTPGGTVIVGASYAFATGAGPAFRWTAAGGTQSLGYLIPNPTFPLHSGANGVSSDGSVVVGWSDSNSGQRAFRWTQAGGMVDLGVVGNAVLSSADAVSADGSVIVGSYSAVSTNLADNRAFIWDAAHGMRDLRQVLLDAGSSGPLLGWALNSARSISADGKTIVGTGTDELGRFQAYIARILPPPCYANCDGSTTPPLLNVNDFACFLNKYAAGDPYANCDGSTTPPVLNVNDFQCFLNVFANGC